MNPNLETKTDITYYSRARKWPSLFNIKKHSLILDIGCGQGILGQYLQETYSAKVTGIEIIDDNYQMAGKVLTNALLGDIEKMDLQTIETKFNYIIFSDSLEHLIDPHKILEKIKELLDSNGNVLLSIPNIRNFRVTVPLIFKDQWEYEDEGLLDRTHLRFFTKTSICNLLDRCGYQVNEVYYDLPLSSKVGILNKLTLGILKNILTSHFFINACLKKS